MAQRSTGNIRLGLLFQTRRELLGLTKTAIAEESGIDASYLTRIEAGDRMPDADKLKAISRALGFDYTKEILPLIVEVNTLPKNSPDATRIPLDRAAQFKKVLPDFRFSKDGDKAIVTKTELKRVESALLLVHAGDGAAAVAEAEVEASTYEGENTCIIKQGHRQDKVTKRWKKIAGFYRLESLTQVDANDNPIRWGIKNEAMRQAYANGEACYISGKLECVEYLWDDNGLFTVNVYPQAKSGFEFTGEVYNPKTKQNEEKTLTFSEDGQCVFSETLTRDFVAETHSRWVG